MHHNYDALLAKLTSAKIANQNRQLRFNYSVLALPLEQGAAHSTSRSVRCDGSSPYQSSRLGNISRYCCVTSGLFDISLGDVSTLRSVATFVCCVYIDQKKRTCVRIFQFEHS